MVVNSITAQNQTTPAPGEGYPVRTETLPPEPTQAVEQENSASGNKELTNKEKKKLRYLKKRDREVRQHEQAHVRAAGNLAKGGPVYEMVTGPDGKQYAIDGHVNIDTSPEPDPKETITKAQRIERAALAPPDPSSEDYSIAAKARRMQSEARQQLRQLKQENGDGKSTPSMDSVQDVYNSINTEFTGTSKLEVIG